MAPDHPNNETSLPASSFWAQSWPVYLLAGLFLVNFASRIVTAPMLPTLEKDLGLGHAAAGSLFIFVSLGYCLSLFLSSLISARLEHRRVITLSAVLLGAALLVLSRADSLWSLRLGLFGLGLAAGIHLPSAISTITGLVEERHWGKAVAIHEIAPNLGLITAPLIAELFLSTIGWQGGFLCLGLFSLALALIHLRLGRGGRMRGQAPNLANLRALIAARDFWVMVLLFGLGIGASLGIYAMLPLFLVAERGMERETANFILSASRVAGLFMAFLGGWLADCIGPRRTLVAGFGLTGLATVLLGLAEGGWLIALMFLQPTLAVCFFPAAFAALSKIGPRQWGNLLVSVTVPLGFILGGGLLPAGIGFLGEAASFSPGIVLSGVFIFGAAGLAALLQKDKSGP